jgi:hypothetical protein
MHEDEGLLIIGPNPVKRAVGSALEQKFNTDNRRFRKAQRPTNKVFASSIIYHQSAAFHILPQAQDDIVFPTSFLDPGFKTWILYSGS